MNNQIGLKIAQFRQDKEISVEDLAAETALHPHQLEMIESGEIKPSIATLIRIAQALKLRPGTILDGAESKAAAVSYAKNLIPTISTSNANTEARNHLDFFSLAQDKNDRMMEPLLVSVKYADPETTKSSLHEGEEFLFVLTGKAVLFYGSEHFELGPGDSIYYDSFVPHLLTTPGPDEKAQVLAVTYIPF